MAPRQCAGTGRVRQARHEQCSVPSSQPEDTDTNNLLHCQGGLQQPKQEWDGAGTLWWEGTVRPLSGATVPGSASASASAKQAQRWLGTIRCSCRELINS